MQPCFLSVLAVNNCTHHLCAGERPAHCSVFDTPGGEMSPPETCRRAVTVVISNGYHDRPVVALTLRFLGRPWKARRSPSRHRGSPRRAHACDSCRAGARRPRCPATSWSRVAWRRCRQWRASPAHATAPRSPHSGSAQHGAEERRNGVFVGVRGCRRELPNGVIDSAMCGLVHDCIQGLVNMKDSLNTVASLLAKVLVSADNLPPLIRHG